MRRAHPHGPLRSRSAVAGVAATPVPCFRESGFIDNLLVRIHFIIVMIGWTGLAPWETLLKFVDR